MTRSDALTRMPAAGDSGPFRVSAVAAQTGLSARQIREWERRGLVTPRRGTGNQRLYDAVDIAKFQRAAKMRAANLRLSEVKVALAVTSGTTGWNDAEGLRLLRSLLQRIGSQLAAAEELAAAIASRIARGPRPSPLLSSTEAASNIYRGPLLELARDRAPRAANKDASNP